MSNTQVMVAGRGAGKTYQLVMWLIEQVLDNTQGRILVGVHCTVDAEIILDQLTDLLPDGVMGNRKRLHGRYEVEMVNRAVIEFQLSTRQSTSRIRGRRYAAVGGERLSEWDESFLEAALMATDGPIFLTADDWSPLVDKALGGSFWASTDSLGHTLSPEYRGRLEEEYGR